MGRAWYGDKDKLIREEEVKELRIQDYLYVQWFLETVALMQV